MTFRVGQKVAAIGTIEVYGKKIVVKDSVYTVAKCFLHRSGEHGIFLAEVECPLPWEGFGASAFRPVQNKRKSQEQGMSILRAIAANPKQKIKENA